MTFKDKYTIDREKTKEENKDKIIISEEAFLNAELQEALINNIEKLRVSLLR